MPDENAIRRRTERPLHVRKQLVVDEGEEPVSLPRIRETLVIAIGRGGEVAGAVVVGVANADNDHLRHESVAGEELGRTRRMKYIAPAVQYIEHGIRRVTDLVSVG